jgi:predicted site-specific integrase-resolvase
MNYRSAKQIREAFIITSQTLKNWKDKGTIKFIKLSSKKFLYDIDSVLGTSDIENRQNVIYARVSNSKQINDLRQQVTFLTQYIVNKGVKPDLIFEDVASGMNEDRTNFNKLIQLVIERKIDTIYISYKDRLTRFGFDYFVNIFSKFGTRIEIVNLTKEEDFQHELTEDLISIIHHFSMKMYSNRRKIFKEISKKFQDGNEYINKENVTII